MLFADKNILVTGGTGFIGSHLVLELLKQKANVSVITRKDRALGGVNFIKGDITDKKCLDRATRSIDIIFHLAGHVDVSGAIENPEINFITSGLGTFLLLDAARKNDAGKFIYVSSARDFGDPQYVPIDEKHPLMAKEPYGASKLVGAIYCNVYYKTYGLRTSVIRPFSVYGPGRVAKKGSLSGVIPIYVKTAFENKDLVVTGRGKQTKDFTYISDVVDALLLAAAKERAIGESFNIGTGKPTSINQLAELVIKLTGKSNIRIRHIRQAKETVSNYADISKSTKILGYVPQVLLETGLKQYIDWYRSARSSGSEGCSGRMRIHGRSSCEHL